MNMPLPSGFKNKEEYAEYMRKYRRRAKDKNSKKEILLRNVGIFLSEHPEWKLQLDPKERKLFNEIEAAQTEQIRQSFKHSTPFFDQSKDRLILSQQEQLAKKDRYIYVLEKKVKDLQKKLEHETAKQVLEKRDKLPVIQAEESERKTGIGKRPGCH
jgi:hypothetical protein